MVIEPRPLDTWMNYETMAFTGHLPRMKEERCSTQSQSSDCKQET